MIGFVLLLIAATQPAGTAKSYNNDFEKAVAGKVPPDIAVLDGTFAVREVNGNKCLELAGDPIGSFGALFGPEGISAMDVRARIWAAATGKRYPEFGIGAGDAGGFKLFLAPGQRIVEIRKGDQARTSAPTDWHSGTWTWLRLRVAKDKSGWTIDGKAWSDGQSEPQNWAITYHDSQTPSVGKASIWGSDFSEQPIRFDDLSVTPIP